MLTNGKRHSRARIKQPYPWIFGMLLTVLITSGCASPTDLAQDPYATCPLEMGCLGNTDQSAGRSDQNPSEICMSLNRVGPTTVSTYWDSVTESFSIRADAPAPGPNQWIRITFLLESSTELPVELPDGRIVTISEAEDNTAFALMLHEISWVLDGVPSSKVELNQMHEPGKLEPALNIVLWRDSETRFFVAESTATNVSFVGPDYVLELTANSTEFVSSFRIQAPISCAEAQAAKPVQLLQEDEKHTVG